MDTKTIAKNSRRETFFLFALLAMPLQACYPEATGKKLFLYVTKTDKSLYADTVKEASKEARHQGTELVVKSFNEFLSQPASAVLQLLSAGDALGLVVYENDWSPELEGQLQHLQTLSKKRQVDIGLWLLGHNDSPSLPASVQGWAGENFDAISSASAERPGKDAAKIFFRPLVEYRGIPKIKKRQ